MFLLRPGDVFRQHEVNLMIDPQIGQYYGLRRQAQRDATFSFD